MLCGFIFASLLISAMGSPGVQAKENGELPSPSNGNLGVILGALTVQRNNRFITGPNDKNVYGSIVTMDNTFDAANPSKRRTLTAIAPGGPRQDGVAFTWFGDDLHNIPQTGNNGVFIGAVTVQDGNTYTGDFGGTNQFGSVVEQSGNVFYGTPSNGNVHFGAVTVQRNNHYNTSPGSKNYFGSRVVQRGVFKISGKSNEEEQSN
nr:uncharacterized protein LOC110381554 [Helicoverpa armigera]